MPSSSSSLSSPNPKTSIPKPLTTEDPLPSYSPPTTGILAHVPASWVPYGELMRIDKPTGIYAFYYHHLFGTLYGSLALPSPPPPTTLLHTNLTLFLGTVFMRGAACSWNDTLDRAYDRQVQRCRLRPIARGALTPTQGHAFTASLALIALAFLLLLPRACWALAVPKIVLLALYPLAKRVTDFPQLVLGCEMALGVFVGAAAVGYYDVRTGSSSAADDTRSGVALLLFYLAQVCWTVVYDTVYAQQDVEDDAKAGVRSMAVRFRHAPRTLLAGVAGVQVGLLVAVGVLQGWGVGYFAVTCAGVGAVLGWNVAMVDLGDRGECLWWFVYGSRMVGGVTALGLGVQAYGW